MRRAIAETALPTQDEAVQQIPGEVDPSGPDDKRADNRNADWSTLYRPLDRAA
ncbi:hypothetical protein [Marivita cryptomonadis]|uniref:Uncharacterized protein n=1 Tax=Marivita cryptomonadis TaxID=505252 RepID=A0A9Q2S1Q6_9RHOB|nr:hypothetical protein [Marivita cryptomonadis]MBM2333241.1 hypothetical protein [Marivita cryptomonadis]MBM2347489.1 hypothetical protein [Marivita cryptomonadis]MBM2352172.1 hypothetical protein [Marivita cryptomonadis]MBM2371346.1 hypothetical protein [Marivita cryptomonadis]MBM2376018.1 hypothetical protein [Marivita cryptomonadis]